MQPGAASNELTLRSLIQKAARESDFFTRWSVVVMMVSGPISLGYMFTNVWIRQVESRTNQWIALAAFYFFAAVISFFASLAGAFQSISTQPQGAHAPVIGGMTRSFHYGATSAGIPNGSAAGGGGSGSPGGA